MKSILIIHQSAELYGSDKTILFFVKELDKSKYFPIVILPADGPLKVELEKINIKVVVTPVLKLYRNIFTPKNLFVFAKEYFQSQKTLAALHKQYNFQLVYSHTLAVLVGIFFARKYNIKHLWHIQEIIAKPAFVNKTFKKLLSLPSNHKAIYDSIQTMKFWINGEDVLAKKSDFVWNGLDLEEKYNSSATEISTIRKDFFKVENNQLVIGLIGRINSWKGQQLLLAAFQSIAADYPTIKLVFVGSAPPNQDFFVDDLKNKISAFNLDNRVEIVPFQQNIWLFWDAIDIAVVPSTEPEPFGMVAIEAMAAKKPVIAANHGGLTEIVLPNETGYLFEPNNKTDLAHYLKQLIENPEKRTDFGEMGYQRVNDVFSMKNHVQKIENIFEEILK